MKIPDGARAAAAAAQTMVDSMSLLYPLDEIIY